jgi:hypothetical protein
MRTILVCQDLFLNCMGASPKLFGRLKTLGDATLRRANNHPVVGVGLFVADYYSYLTGSLSAFSINSWKPAMLRFRRSLPLIKTVGVPRTPAWLPSARSRLIIAAI